MESNIGEKDRIISEITTENNLLSTKYNNILSEHKQFENELINVQSTLLQAETREKDHLTQT
jgi:hypothetical protein